MNAYAPNAGFPIRMARPVTAWLLSTIFALLTCPARAAEVGAGALDIEIDACIASFEQEFAGSAATAAGLQAVDRAACVDLLTEAVAIYGQPIQPMRGKPPSPPPPPPPTTPPARDWHAFTGNGSEAPDASRLYLLGGAGTDATTVPADLWYFSVYRDAWFLAPTGKSKPGNRQHAGLSCSVGQCVTSNGSNGISDLMETWTYTHANGTWSQVNCRRNLCPSARMGPAMAYDPARGFHLLFGGMHGWNSLDDTLTFAAGRWTAWQPKHTPPARDRATAVFVGAPVNGIVLFGGQQDELLALSDMYAWLNVDGKWDWIEVIAGNERPRLHSHSMAWDEGDGRVVVSGGFVDTHDTPSQDIWYFTFSGATSGTWTKATGGRAACAADADPGARMAFDRPTGKLAFFGGATSSDPASRSDKLVVCD